MQALPIKALIPDTMDVYGALELEECATGLRPRRLPAWTRIQLPEFMDFVVRTPSGVRLRFATDATRLGLGVLITRMIGPGLPMRPAQFNLEINGKLWSASTDSGNTIELDPSRPQGFRMERGDSGQVWFENLPSGDKQCELWLTHNAFVELQELLLEEGAAVNAPSPESRPKWIHYGSSISHCMEADQPALIWPAVAARQAGAALQNLGFGGQCHLDSFVARTIRDSDADIISIKVGINIINMDAMRERIFTPALHGFLDTVREGKPNAPIMLISPIYCPCAENSPGPTIPGPDGKFNVISGPPELRMGSLSLVRVRELIAQAVEARREAGDRNLHYLDGLTLFGEGDAHDLPDDLHPNPAGYIRMGERFAPTLAALMSGSWR